MWETFFNEKQNIHIIHPDVNGYLYVLYVVVILLHTFPAGKSDIHTNILHILLIMFLNKTIASYM